METRRLLWLTGVFFAVVLMVQYLELPNALSSLFYAGKAEVLVLGTSPTENSSLVPNISENLAFFGGSKFSFTTAAPDIAKTTKAEDRDLRNDFIAERTGDSNDSLDLDEDGDPEDEISSENFIDANINSMKEKTDTNNSSAREKVPESGYITDTNSPLGSIREENNVVTSPALSPFGVPPIISPPPLTSPKNEDTNSRIPSISSNPNTSSVDHKGAVDINAMTKSHAGKEKSQRPLAEVMSISEMDDLLRQSRASSRAWRPRWSSSVDQELLNAKSQIENAPILGNHADLYAPLYRNVSMFKRSYELMEQTLRVYIYREGERPIFHQPLLKGIYASEGWFMKQLKSNKHLVTKKPRNAHLFYLPFSSRMLEVALYVPNSHNRKNLVQHLKNYLDRIVARYPFWNRTSGVDHFLVACHDWAPSETKEHMGNCLRALCNTAINLGFELGKDVSLPTTNVRSAQNPLRELGGKPPSQRRILAFFAGNMHGYLRPILLQYWENKDPDMKIFGRMHKVKGEMNYVQHMKSSKYCICAKGYEVNSPRVVEAIFYECVPVIISDNFVPPFFNVLNWESFAVFVLEKDIPNLKKILLSIPEKRYLKLQQAVKQVQQHFLWHARPVKYDIFHMILHSIWYNRVFQLTPRG